MIKLQIMAQIEKCVDKQKAVQKKIQKNYDFVSAKVKAEKVVT